MSSEGSVDQHFLVITVTDHPVYDESLRFKSALGIERAGEVIARPVPWGVDSLPRVVQRRWIKDYARVHGTDTFHDAIRSFATPLVTESGVYHSYKPAITFNIECEDYQIASPTSNQATVTHVKTTVPAAFASRTGTSLSAYSPETRTNRSLETYTLREPSFRVSIADDPTGASEMTVSVKLCGLGSNRSPAATQKVLNILESLNTELQEWVQTVTKAGAVRQDGVTGYSPHDVVRESARSQVARLLSSIRPNSSLVFRFETADLRIRGRLEDDFVPRSKFLIDGEDNVLDYVWKPWPQPRSSSEQEYMCP